MYCCFVSYTNWILGIFMWQYLCHQNTTCRPNETHITIQPFLFQQTADGKFALIHMDIGGDTLTRPSRDRITCIICSLAAWCHHYYDVIMDAIASQITSLTIVYSTVYSDADQSKHQSSASLAFVREIHRGPVNFPHKWPVTRKMFPFDDVIMQCPYAFPVCSQFAQYERVHQGTIAGLAK